MKKNILFFLIPIFFLNCSKTEEPEVIYEGNIIFNTQQQIDDFGKVGYTKVVGYVVIGDENGNPTSSIENINSLNTLTSVDGLSIIGNTVLSNINPLNKLEHIGSLWIYGNTLLTNIDGLVNVSSNLVYIKIENNKALENIDGLRNISIIRDLDNNSPVAGSLQIIGNGKLKNLNGLSNLDTVSGIINIAGNSLNNLDGLRKLTSAKFLSVTWNSNLTNLCGIQLLIENISEFNIENNAYNPTKQDFIDGNCSN